MIWLPARTKLYDVVVAIQIAQAAGEKVKAADPDSMVLLQLAGVASNTTGVGDPKTLAFGRAFVLASKRSVPYAVVVAEESGFAGITLDKPKLSLPELPAMPNAVSMCPFPIVAGLGFEDNRPWAFVHQHLKTYGLDVLLVSDHNEWMDNCPFPECDILSEAAMSFKVAALAASTLVVGVPNAWTWLAVALGVPVVLFYPDWMPAHRWFPFEENNIARALFSHPTQVPMVLAALRQLIAAVPASAATA
jgi:hypothetical protein